MARAHNRLKAITVAKASITGLLADGNGLYLRVGPTGAKSWVFRYRRDGKLHDMGLGPLHTISLAEAREKALACRKQRLEQTDPLEARRASQLEAKLAADAAVTFRECAARYIEAHKAGWRGDHEGKQWAASLENNVHPIIGDLPVQRVDVAAVMRVLDPIWKTKTVTAARVRGRIASILDWATVRGYRTGENPARWQGHLANLLPEKSKVRPVQHHAALPYNQVAAFLVTLRQQAGAPARALEFAILTAARASEAAGARWSEIDMAQRLWIVPASRMKSAKEHRVPLSDAAMAIMEAMAEGRQCGEFVFRGRRRGTSITIDSFWQLLRRMKRDDLTVHGFRSTFRDWCAERTNFPREVAEMALSHAVGDATERAYARGDLFQKRQQLAEAWARFCAAPASNGEVVPLHAAG